MGLRLASAMLLRMMLPDVHSLGSASCTDLTWVRHPCSITSYQVSQSTHCTAFVPTSILFQLSANYRGMTGDILRYKVRVTDK